MSTSELTPLQIRFRAARNVSAPILAITTPDPAATIASLMTLPVCVDSPILRWDSVDGLTAINRAGEAARVEIIGPNDPSMTVNPAECLGLLTKAPEDSIVFFMNAHRYLDGSSQERFISQGIWNLRDPFKLNRRTLVLLGPVMDVPAELTNDVVVLDEALPGAGVLRSIVERVLEDADLTVEETQIEAAVDGVRGLSAFSAEQVVAMSLNKNGINIDRLWERKQRMIESTPGLKVWRGTESFSGVRGVDNVQTYIEDLLGGPAAPRVLVFIDEIEKQFAGAGTDTSGTKGSALGTILTYMEDHEVLGLMFVGPPGAAKSATVKAIPLQKVVLDLPSTESSLVGASNASLRAALKVISAVSDDSVMFVATSNNVSSLPVELRRRFELTFFFDLPTAAERAAIWEIYEAKYNVSGERPNDKDWTGAEIRNCCRTAYRLRSSLKKAAGFIVPVAVSGAEKISALRRDSSGRFTSASRDGIYIFDQTATDMVDETPDAEVIGVVVATKTPPNGGRRRINKKDLN
jgi:hypothetical protein